MTQKAIFSCSGGKDSARALYEARLDGQYDIVALLTNVTRYFDRVSMHGVRTSLVDEQARATGLEIEKIFISAKASDDEYDEQMRQELLKFKTQGISCVLFRDIFLEDLRQYRENRLAEVVLKAVFPIWDRDTAELTVEFVETGFKAVTTCIDSRVLDEIYVGRVIDGPFISSLPPGIDPCGENGEFHSLVYDGPLFNSPVKFRTADKILREGFYFCDRLPAAEG